ncbi:TIGR02234 family membrane protein [Tsukamurella sp. 8F]|uniref:TIGR02234 family membrane protein n=1 Tax=unclassified Tsukamurella TaxID=2633480 RepID=UPI0023B995E5|nr:MULTISPECIES: TIGR02234 family membrane protein [unclassified Tsukamurella]MDF0529229.1 TIGR02234 family membrane protein [Tsukamurella sp. 8J]MDF0585414.1 TIGR02234 family membrane protein [Tsukamurella sp. 8F]
MTAAAQSRRPLVIASAGLALAAAALWGASRMRWSTLTVADGLGPPRTLDIDGQRWAGALTPLALVLLAGIAAVLAVKGRARRVVAVLVALVGVASTLPALGVLTSDPDVAHATEVLELSHKDVPVDIHMSLWGPVVSLVGCALAVAAAVVLVRAGRGGPAAAAGDRYLSPAARRAALEKKVFGEDGAPSAEASEGAVTKPDGAGETTERDLWDALDTGADPTDATPNEGRRKTGG